MRRRPLLVFIICALVLVFAASCKKKAQEGTASNLPNVEGADWFAVTRQKLAKNPDDADAWYELAYLYDGAKVYDKAADAYLKAINLNPKGYIYFKLGNDYSRMNRPEKAITAFKMANKLMHGYAMAYNNMGVAYGKLGKTDEEIQSYMHAIKLRPSYPDPVFNLGVAYLKKGDRASALKQYNALSHIDEGEANVLGKLLNVKGK
ncbi:MAG: tetratricopeptide repeat protein [Actinomycetota bacterium]|nr:tetratricopeptide repeat protein [Actinomycetota bacterium]